MPSTTTRKLQTKDFEYVKGFNTNTSNDDVPQDQWRYISDSREIEIGKWKTRQGNDFWSVPIGEAVNVQQTSTTGASDFAFNATTRFAKKVVALADGRLTALEINIKNASTATGTVVLALYSDSAGAPSTELFRTTIAGSSVTGAYQYLKGRSITCPQITNGTTYWVVGFVQDGGSGSYSISTTTNASTGLSSSNGGTTWAAASLDFNVKLSTSTSGGVKGLVRLRRPNGTSYTFFAHSTSIYSVNEGTGVTTAVDTTISASSTVVRFAYVNDVLYYVDGFSKPHKYDFATATIITAAPENTNNIVEHKGIVFYTSADNEGKVYFTNFAAYDTYTSTDFFYVPAPKTADQLVAKFKLNGLLFLVTRNNKHVLYGAENATFRLDQAIGQKGTFSQESVAYDQNSAFLASDDGIYQFNGASEKNIARDVLNWWTALNTKTTVRLELWNNRLYVFYTPNGQAQNSMCRVYNVEYGVWESEDTLTYVGSTFSRNDVNNYFLQGSNLVGMVMLGELATNDYCTMGEPLTYELRTRYDHYDAPAQYKRAPFFRPHFDAVSSSYSVQIGYATEYSDAPTYANLNLQGSGPRFDTGYTWNSGITFNGSQQINPMDSGPGIPGEWRRLQLRYKHYAAREPVSFDGHVLDIEVQRLI